MVETFEETAPSVPELTDYDRAHIKLYMRLLDATAEGAPWQEVVALLFGIDPAREPERGRRVHDSHLARAQWVAAGGYKDLLRQPH